MCEQLYDILAPYLTGRTGLAFGQSPTTPFSYNAVRDRAARVWKSEGLEPFDLQLHEGRHTFRTLMADAGIPRDRRDKYLGHADHSVGGRYEHQLDHQYLADAKTFSTICGGRTRRRGSSRCATTARQSLSHGSGSERSAAGER